MKRYNLFNQIHKGIRVLFCDTAIKLQQTGFNRESDTDEILAQLDEVSLLCSEHTDKVNTHILPIILEYEPSVADLLTREQKKGALLFEQLNSNIKTLVATTNHLEVKTQSEKLVSVFTEYMLFQLQYIQKEESLLNPVLWHYCEDRELTIIQRKMAASLTRRSAALAIKWIMRGLSNTEIVAWLQTIDKSATEETFDQVFRIAEKELTATRFRMVLEDLTEGIMIS